MQSLRHRTGLLEKISIVEALVLIIVYTLYSILRFDTTFYTYILVAITIAYINISLYKYLVARIEKDLLFILPVFYIAYTIVCGLGNSIVAYIIVYTVLLLILINTYPYEFLDTLYHITRYRELLVLMIIVTIFTYTTIGINESIIFIILLPFIEIAFLSSLKNRKLYITLLYSITLPLYILYNKYYIIYTIASLSIKAYTLKNYTQHFNTIVLIDLIVRTVFVWLISYGG